jgi:hypothetical protein
MSTGREIKSKSGWQNEIKPAKRAPVRRSCRDRLWLQETLQGIYLIAFRGINLFGVFSAKMLASADLADSIPGEAAPAIRGIGSEGAKVESRNAVKPTFRETNIS